MEFKVVPQPFHHMHTDITGVVRPNNIVSRKIQQSADCITQNGAAQVPDMQRFVGIWLREFHHHLFMQVRSTAVIIFFLLDRFQHPRCEMGCGEINVEVPFYRLDPVETSGQMNAFGDRLRDLLGAFSNAGVRIRQAFGGCCFEK